MILPIFHYDFQSKLRTFGVLYYEYANVFKEIDIFMVKKIFEVYPTQNILRYLPQRDQKAPSGI